MGIFSKDKYLLALFDDEKAADQALDDLHKHGFGTEDSNETLEVMEQSRFKAQDASGDIINEDVVGQPAVTSSNPPGAAVAMDPASQAKGKPAAIRKNVQTELVDQGVDEEEASFFAERVARGGVVVLLQSNDSDRISEALQIVNQTSTKKVITS